MFEIKVKICSPNILALLSGIFSAVMCLIVILISTMLLINTAAWSSIMQTTVLWLEGVDWSEQVNIHYKISNFPIYQLVFINGIS